MSAPIKDAGCGGSLMETIEQQSVCPHCRRPFEIVFIKFGFSNMTIVACCPNCALAAPARWGAKVETPDRETSKEVIGWKGTTLMLDRLNLRLNYVLAFMIGAVITAAALRHGFHVYGGLSREEIRDDALMAIPLVALAAVFLLRRR
jgi:hypothetical protein